MILSAIRIKERILGVSPEETTFARRGFTPGDAAIQKRLERIGLTFVNGYNVALGEDRPDRLATRLDAVEPDFRGVAFEGAAMALTLLDYVTPWKKDRLTAFLKGPGAAHVYMAHVGAGWALARLRRNANRFLARRDPLLGWLAVDGYGFHEGYFHWRRFFREKAPPGRLTGYARRAFDQGLGRSLWFVDCADVSRIPATIAAFPEARQADLWSGIGLACAYAGGADRHALESLRAAAGRLRSHAAQGAAFAAKARERAGNPAPHTELACKVWCGLSAEAAANLTDASLDRLSATAEAPSYEVWRRRIQSQFAEEVVTA